MSRCEDFPCCGHELGCCPDYDEGGRQLNMVCVCGKKLPINNRYSICDACMNRNEDGEGEPYCDEYAMARSRDKDTIGDHDPELDDSNEYPDFFQDYNDDVDHGQESRWE